MTTGKEKWQKGKTVIEFNVILCDCGEKMNYLGSAGCAHDDNQTYFYQCLSCKKIELNWQEIRIENPENLKSAGWKPI